MASDSWSDFLSDTSAFTIPAQRLFGRAIEIIPSFTGTFITLRSKQRVPTFSA